jgi:hypothetical protein
MYAIILGFVASGCYLNRFAKILFQLKKRRISQSRWRYQALQNFALTEERRSFEFYLIIRTYKKRKTNFGLTYPLAPDL